LLAVALARRLLSRENCKELDALRYRTSVDLFQMGTNCGILETYVSRFPSWVDREGDPFHHHPPKSAPPKWDTEPTAKAHQSPADVMDIITCGRRNRRVDQYQTDDARIRVPIEKRMIRART
jgi:hypothetical protein